MNTILLISEDYLKTNSNLNDNAFGKWILPAIREAQEMSLMPIIGECLYNKVCELVSNGLIDNDLYAAYKDLLDDRIQPFLLYQTLTNIVPIINGKMANIGTVATNDEHIITLSQGELDLTQNYYRERADFYAKRLQDWVKNNREAFPELECVCSAKPNLERVNNSVGIFLGGTRGKKVATSSCGCGSSSKSTDGSYQDGFMDGFNQGMQSGYTSGHTDGYEEGLEDGCENCSSESFESGYTSGVTAQKAKLVATAITENGIYAREDGFSSIEVNVPQSEMALQTKSVSQSAVTATYTPDEGYDGIRVITVNATKLAQDKYDQGYADGASKTSCNLQRKSVEMSSTTKTIVPDSGYDGMNEVFVNASDVYYRGYADGYSEADGIEITPTNTVNLTEYGRYYFVYNENTSVQSMLVYFNHEGTPSTTGTSTVEITLDSLTDVKDCQLYNPNSDTTSLVGITINGDMFTGSTYTGKIKKVEYEFDGVIPDEFFSGVRFTGRNDGSWRVTANGNLEIKPNAFSNTKCVFFTLIAYSDVIVRGDAIRDNKELYQMTFSVGGLNGNGKITVESGGIINHTKLTTIDFGLGVNSNSFNAASDTFNNSKEGGWINNASTFIDIESQPWWSYLDSIYWHINN